jgi:hypothetical protein
MGPYDEDKPVNTELFNLARIIVNIGYLFYALWLLFLCVEIKLQAEQRSFVDIKFNLYVVEFKSTAKKAKQSSHKLISRDENHIALSDQPGNFDNAVIKEISIDDLTEFNKSIDVKKQNMLDNLKVEYEKKKQIEVKEKSTDE